MDLSNNFTQLNQDISNSDETFNVTKDYTRDFNESINISKSINIDGNGYSFNSNDSIGFNVSNSSNITFNNLTFNCNRLYFNICENETITIKLINCSFYRNDVYSFIEVHNYGDEWGYGQSCKITSAIKNLALKIIGNSKGMDAAKKLTLWVGKNIKYEAEAGFYQTPTDTLNRKRGNCCCQSDLLAQMLVAVGLADDHEICFIHVGNNHYGQRHYFLMIDNFCLDPTLGSPWGHGGFHNRPAEVTPYPILPLPYGNYR